MKVSWAMDRRGRCPIARVVVSRPSRDLRGLARLVGLTGLCSILLTCAGSSAELRAGRPGTIEEGKATYYAARLAGHRTANGERYDPAAFTAAHPVLPFGTRVRVTRVESVPRSVIVRINDRCASGKKIIDLSEAAARQLGMLRAGIVRVRLQVVSGPKK